MKNPVLIFSIPLIISFGCKKPSEFPENFPNKIADKQFTLVSSGTIEIPIDSITNNYSLYPVYYENDTAEYYIYGNEIIHSIDFYDLNKRKLVRRNMYGKEGADGISSTLKMCVTSLDSIYIYADEKILLTNFEGKILAGYPLSLPCCPMPYWLSPVVIENGNVFTGYMVKGDNREQSGHKSMLKANLSTGTFEEYGVEFPSVFSRYLYNSFHGVYAFGHDNNIVVRFGALPDIYVYNQNTDSTRVIPMQSRFQLAPIRPDKEATQFMEVDENFREIVQPNYLSVSYDPYNHVYYSTYQQGLPLYDSAGNKSAFEDKPVSIIIFNEAFEYGGELKLKEKTYFFGNYICTKNGLMIPTSHSKNPNNNEDILQFEIFKLQPVN